MMPNLPLWLKSWLRLVPKFWLAWNQLISPTCCTCCYNVEMCVCHIMQSNSKLFYILLLEFCQTEQKKQKKRIGLCPLTHSRTRSSWPFKCVQKQMMPATFDNSLKNSCVPLSPNSLSHSTFNLTWILLKLTLILLTWRIWWAPNNAGKWHTGFNSAFKGLMYFKVGVTNETVPITSRSALP